MANQANSGFLILDKAVVTDYEKQLAEIRERVGAKLGEYFENEPEYDADSDTEFGWEDLESGRITVDENGALYDTVTKQHFLAYIRDKTFDSTTKSEPKDLSRIHFSRCKTLDRMEKAGRKDRYRKRERTSREEDDIYKVDVKEINSEQDITIKTPLFPCKHCLKKLNYQMYMQKSKSERRLILEGFKSKEYFEKCRLSTKFVDWSKDLSSDLMATKGYTKDWPQIRLSKLKIVDYTCNRCHFKSNKEYVRNEIDVHHRNGNKSNNSSTNLEALCLACHGEEHSHYKSSPRYKRFVSSPRYRASFRGYGRW